MEVILLERVPRLGQMGEVVRVKDGFARNFLLPRGKALRATAENRTRFETMKGDLEARSLTLKSEAGQVAEKLDGKSFTVAAPGLGSRSAFRIGFAARSRRPACDVWIQCQPQSDRAQHADQNDRPARRSDRAASGHRDVDHHHRRPQCRRSGAHRARRGCHAIARRADAGGRGRGCRGSLLRARGRGVGAGPRRRRRGRDPCRRPNKSLSR